MLPEFLIIGAQKSATSTLDWMLSKHPQIYLPNQEIPFFEDPDYGKGNLEPLEALYRNAPPLARLGLKRPNYLARPECPSRIALCIPNAKLIAILRDPIRRAVSAYFHYMRGGSLPCQDINVGMMKILDGAYAAKYPRSREVLDFGMYSEHVERYFSHFPRERFFFINQKLFLQDIRENVSRICEFLEVDPPPVDLRIPRKKKGVYWLPRVRMHQIANSFLTTRSEDGMRGHARQVSLLRKSPGYTIRAIDRATRWMWPNEEPRLCPALEQRLYSYYKEDMERLAVLLGPDFAFEACASQELPRAAVYA